MTIIDDKTAHLKLPLPNRDNLLWDDVVRLREAMTTIDAKIKAIDTLLSSDDVNLEDLQELVNAIKENHNSIDAILTSKLSVAEFNRLTAPPSAVAYSYNAQNLVDSVTETVAGKPRQTTYAYNSEGLPETITTYEGKMRVETYSYSAGRVAGVSVTENES